MSRFETWAMYAGNNIGGDKSGIHQQNS